MTELEGFRLLPGYLSGAGQDRLIDEIVDVVTKAPFYIPTMPRTGKPMSVEMTNCGPLGWVTDKEGGYRYQAMHPATNRAWPPIPRTLLDIWNDVCDYPQSPEACLINHYRPSARMGLHKDSDEKDFSAPVVSISIGCAALFRIGGPGRKDPTRSIRLGSGDVVVLGGTARLAYHGVDRILAGTSTRLDAYREVFSGGGRLNLTLRRVTVP